MEIIEKIGLLKVDFLGLSTLTVMRLAAQLIEQRHGVRYTMENIPYDLGHCGPGKDSDKGMEKAFEMLGRGDVQGVCSMSACAASNACVAALRCWAN